MNTTVAKDLIICELKADELDAASRLLSRGMRDNPNNVRVFGSDRKRREQALTRMFLPALRRAYAKGTVSGAFDGGKMVGVRAMAAPGQCQLSVCEKLRIVPAMFVGNSLSTPLRIWRWVDEWSRQDLSEPHWHLGPLAVDGHLQGQGIGSAMMADFCARMDEWGSLSYLETDKSENVRFYKEFGFTVVADSEILGVPNWFMCRRTQAGAARNARSDGCEVHRSS